MQQKLKKATIQQEKQKRLLEQKQREVQFAETEINQKVAFGNDRLKALEQNNQDLAKQQQNLRAQIDELKRQEQTKD